VRGCDNFRFLYGGANLERLLLDCLPGGRADVYTGHVFFSRTSKEDQPLGVSVPEGPGVLLVTDQLT
jgi:hypothetical protein